MSPGEQPDPNNDHVPPHTTRAHATKADILMRHLMCLTNAYLARALEQSLERQGSPVSGFTYIYEAANKLRMLKAKNPAELHSSKATLMSLQRGGV